MKLYTFQGIKTDQNKKISGTVKGPSKKSCIQELLEQNVYVLHISTHRFSSKPLHFDFFLYWSKLLNFSIPTQDIFSLLSHQFKNNNLDIVSQLLNEGIPVVEALKRIPDFDPTAIHLIDIGIKTNQLPHILMTLHDYYQKDDLYKKDLRLSLLYPGITCVFIMIAFGVSLSHIDSQYLNHSYLWMGVVLLFPFLIPKKYWPIFKKQQHVDYVMKIYLLLQYKIPILDIMTTVQAPLHHCQAIEQGVPLKDCLKETIKDFPILLRFLSLLSHQPHEFYKACILEKEFLFEKQKKMMKLVEPIFLSFVGLMILMFLMVVIMPLYTYLN